MHAYYRWLAREGDQMQLTTRVRADLLTAGQQDVTPDSARGVLLGHGHGSMGTTCCSATFIAEPAEAERH
jgi:hypothetical protein